jgi:hypothetical protein
MDDREKFTIIAPQHMAGLKRPIMSRWTSAVTLSLYFLPGFDDSGVELPVAMIIVV